MHFEKLYKEDKVRIEEEMYAMMYTFKTTPLEISTPIPRILSTIIEQKWSHCIVTKRQIQEATLAWTMPTLGKKEIK